MSGGQKETMPPASDQVTVRRARDGEARVCEEILRALPDWFGIEESIIRYRRDIETMETYVAELGGRTVGFLTLKPHNSHTEEIQVIAVRPEHHGKGAGRALVLVAEGLLRSRSVEFLQVKTLGPSRPNDHYARTREFYLSMGYRPVEENNLWGEVNPCLIMIKHLVCG